MIVPATAEAKSRKHNDYRRHYENRHSRHHHQGSYCGVGSRHRHYYGGRSVYYYGTHRWAYGYPRYYTPSRRSGINVHVDL
jgi:hypothetical protein